MNILEKIKTAINSRQLVEISAHLNNPEIKDKEERKQGLSNRKCIPIDIKGEGGTNPKFLFYDLDSPRTEHFLTLPLNKLYSVDLLPEKFDPTALGFNFRNGYTFERNWSPQNDDISILNKMKEFCESKSIVQLVFKQNNGQISKRHVIAHKIDADSRLKSKIYKNYKQKFADAEINKDLPALQNLIKSFERELNSLPQRFQFLDLDSPELEHYLSILPEGVISLEKALATDFYKIKLPNFAKDREAILNNRKENIIVKKAEEKGINLEAAAEERQTSHERVLEQIFNTAKAENKLLELDVHSISHGRIKRIVSYLGKNDNGAEGCYVFEDFNSPEGKHIAQFNKYQIEDARKLDITKPTATAI